MNIKKAWETLQAGRAEKAMESRQKFFDSLQAKADDTTNVSESCTEEETSSTIVSSSTSESLPQQVTKRISITKKTSPSTKNGYAKDETTKQTELVSYYSSSSPQIDEPLLDEPPVTKPKLFLPPLDLKFFLK